MSGAGVETGLGFRVASLDREALVRRYEGVRGLTVSLVEPLSAEDMSVQVAMHASPAKWHLAHTTWFFETFVLERFERGFEPYDERFRVLFNSYYNGVGVQHPRHLRGVLTRPGVGEVMAFRDTVDERLKRVLSSYEGPELAELVGLVELGLQHERQHQELLLTDVRLLLHANPVKPVYRDDLRGDASAGGGGPMDWVGFDAGVVEVGFDASVHGDGFAYDNEGPRHRRFVEAFEIGARPVTNAEFRSFVEDGGYERSALWLELGWQRVKSEGWASPLFWERGEDGSWREYTFGGSVPLDGDRVASGLSFYEADAYARWAGARLPTEVEWEHACGGCDAAEGNFVDEDRLRPGRVSADAEGGVAGAFGDVWEWTRSAHEPYPGYAPPAGAVGEYNGKFMCNQYVLRGGSCLTSRDHVRPTYRNFFEPEARWQMSGVRLARTV